MVFRYAIFGHNHAHTIGSSGIAELPGNDFMVTLGGWSPLSIQAVGGQQAVEAGTFMHELGHTLILRHGGTDDINCKPNYLSVMSYSRQFPNPIPTRPLNYSDSVIPSLYERSLNEPLGIQGPAGQETVYNQSPDAGVVGPRLIISANQAPVDWDGIDSDLDGIIDTTSVQKLISTICLA